MSDSAEIVAQPSITQQIQDKLAELAELVSLQQYGPEGPPKDLTFRQIESAGHQVAQLAAAKFESAASEQHQRHFDGAQRCPQCGLQCDAQDKTQRRILTRLGPVDISEIKFHCNACRRSFFPSA